MTTKNTDNSKSQKSKIYKILFILWGILLWWSIAFFAANSYENNNGCLIEFKSSPPFLTCKPTITIIEATSGSQLFKPLILIYPQQSQHVQVQLQYNPWFFATYPKYDGNIKGWEVVANPDWTLFDKWTLQETYWLFWEWHSWKNNYDMSKWFIIKWKNIREFLSKKLDEIGLNTKERSDFIMFWYPKLQHHKYLQITFAGDDYTSQAPLKITPKPDSLLRVFMVAKPLENKIKIPEQKLERFERKWLSVVEWWWTIMQ